MTNFEGYSFEKLEVWQLGMEIVHEVYSLTRKFPEEEKFGLTSQMRRAAISIPLNIAEGSSLYQKRYRVGTRNKNLHGDCSSRGLHI
jgi:hypothetical protein